MSWKITTICIMAHLLCIGADVDYMALLSETLRTRYRLGCTTSSAPAFASMILHCPPGTTISVTLANYTDNPTFSVDKRSPKNGLSHAPEVPRCPTPVITGNEIFNLNCTSNLQTKWREVGHGSWGRYSLLQTVVETCQKKRQCRISTNQGNERDPCALHPQLYRPRLIELAYKCRPYEFRSKVACDGERVSLSCNPGSRLAIYSAVYGRTEYETLHCPQPPGVPEETCVAESGTRTVMRACHGRRSCLFTTTPQLFHPINANPCKHPSTKPYLYVVYTCVPRTVLADEYEVTVLPDEDELPSELEVLEEGFDKADFQAAFSPSPNLVGPPSGMTYSTTTSRTPLLRTPLSKEGLGLNSEIEQQERDDAQEEDDMIYVWVGVCCGVLVALGGVLTRVIYQLHPRQPVIPNAPQDKYQADIVAIEADLDLTSSSSMHKKRNVPHLVEDTIIYTKDTRFPSAPVSAIHRGMEETSLVSRNDLETPLRSGTLFPPLPEGGHRGHRPKSSEVTGESSSRMRIYRFLYSWAD